MGRGGFAPSSESIGAIDWVVAGNVIGKYA